MEEIKIPTKPKKTPTPEAGDQNGHSLRDEAELQPVKRPHPESAEDTAAVKKIKTAAAPDADDEVVIVEDSGAGGAIVIDDD